MYTQSGRRPFQAPNRIALLLLLIALLVGLSSCATTDEKFSVVVGASKLKSDIVPCSDYASFYSYTNTPYYVRDAITGKVTSRHEGIDFCTAEGADVLAPADGVIAVIDPDNVHRGGRITIRTKIEFKDNVVLHTLHVDLVHITPNNSLKTGDEVKAGQVIGVVQPAGKQEIGPRPHVHLSAGPTYNTWAIHTDPNRFWQKGPGVVTCFDPKNPPTPQQIVAPVRCSKS
jgi:hypothetical protein